MSKNAIKEAERIAKEIGGHIPERVEEEYIHNDEELLKPERPDEKPTILITLDYYTQLIENIGFLNGRNVELEKQLKELKRPVEYTKLEEKCEK